MRSSQIFDPPRLTNYSVHSNGKPLQPVRVPLHPAIPNIWRSCPFPFLCDGPLVISLKTRSRRPFGVDGQQVKSCLSALQSIPGQGDETCSNQSLFDQCQKHRIAGTSSRCFSGRRRNGSGSRKERAGFQSLVRLRRFSILGKY